jgi:putative radical SAM enzyme (TIGR03279 family)
MSVKIKSVTENSYGFKAGLMQGDEILKINSHEIFDVLDYRFYQNEKRLKLRVEVGGKVKTYRVKKSEYEELGLVFDTYLMDEQRSCKNKCVFCFIDQLPKGMRESLYFKDDDSRLSFLFGNYITLTNITEHEIERIIKLHISPINISVHTTNPELRCKMMNNRFAGDALSVLYRLADAGIAINCQLVLCPEYNDGEELRRSLTDLTSLSTVQSIAAVPVGLTAHREGLAELKPFNKQTASAVLDIIDEFSDLTLEKYGKRRVFGSDEFYILSEREIPNTDYYEDFLQLENGVGMWSLFKSEALSAVENDFAEFSLLNDRKVTVATGESAYPLIKNIVDISTKKWHNLYCNVVKIKNNFFGGHITVTGLVTGGDLIDQLKNEKFGEYLLISSSMLRFEKDKFLDDVTVTEVEKALRVKVLIIENDGFEFVANLLGN